MGLFFKYKGWLCCTLFLLGFSQSKASVQVMFNRSEESSYTETYRGIRRDGEDFERALVKTAQSAKRSLWIAVQEIRLPELAKVIAQKKQEGVDVRLILESSYNYDLREIQDKNFDKKQGYHGERNQEYFKFADINGDGQISLPEALDRDSVFILKHAGVPLKDDTADGSAGSGLMHHKFMLIDDAMVLVSSANFTMSDVHGDYSNIKTRGNANSLMVFDSSDLYNVFAEEFLIMWGHQNEAPKFGVQKPYRPAKTVRLGSGESVTVQFAGTSRTKSDEHSTIGLILRAIRQAKKTVNMALFVFSEPEFASQLKKLHESQGVVVKSLIEPTFAYRYYSKSLDMWGLQLLPENCRPAPGSQPWHRTNPYVGVPVIEKGDFLHHKFAVIDSEVVIVGSHNWSRAASDKNDETLMVIKSSHVASRFQKEFSSWYSNAKLGAPDWLVKAAQESQSRCRSN